MVRAALGEKKLTYMGASYGTYFGAVYATLFPGHVRRMVFDSVVNPDPRQIWYRNNLDQNIAFERRWGDWLRWVAKHHTHYRLGKDAKAVQRAYDSAVEEGPPHPAQRQDRRPPSSRPPSSRPATTTPTGRCAPRRSRAICTATPSR